MHKVPIAILDIFQTVTSGETFDKNSSVKLFCDPITSGACGPVVLSVCMEVHRSYIFIEKYTNISYLRQLLFLFWIFTSLLKRIYPKLKKDWYCQIPQRLF